MGSLAARLPLYVLRLMNPSRHVQATLRPGTQDIVVYGLNKEMLVVAAARPPSSRCDRPSPLSSVLHSLSTC